MTNHRLQGGCHCGNLSYMFETSAGFDQLDLRMCTCGFCRKHGQRSASDPNGRVTVSIKDPAKLKRYRFALNTTDFLICETCGVYIGATLEDKDGAWMVANVNSLDERPPLDSPAVIHNFDSEDVATRVARRKKVWTPLSYKDAA